MIFIAMIALTFAISFTLVFLKNTIIHKKSSDTVEMVVIFSWVVFFMTYILI